MQNRVPNQMNSLAGMAGVGRAAGRHSELLRGQQRGAGAAAGPSLPGLPGTEQQQRTLCRTVFCTGKGLQRSVSPRAHAEESLQQNIEVRHGLTGQIVSNEAFSYPQPQSACF